MNGCNTHEIFQFLRFHSSLNKKTTVAYVPWNFAKFLLDAQGNVVKYYEPHTQPHEMMEDIEKLLNIE